MVKFRARACIKCEEYVLIRPNDPLNQDILKQFEGNHSGHTLIILNIDEVKEKFKEI